MSYFNTCPNCGSHLDPGEKCDCQKNSENCAQIGHEIVREDRVTDFTRHLERLHNEKPAVFVAILSMLQVMTDSENKDFGLQYPQEIFIEAIRQLDASRKYFLWDPEMSDAFVQAIALICDKWLKAAC